MYAYDFEGRRYDVGEKWNLDIYVFSWTFTECKLGFLQATVEYALRKEDLKDSFMEYLKTIIG